MKFILAILSFLFFYIQVKGNEIDFDSNDKGVVLIANNFSNDTCYGVFIHAEWVLTSASCARKTFYKEMRVILGRNRTFNSGLPIRNTYIHPEYNSECLENDIALLELAKSADEYIRIYKIPRVNSSLVGKKAKVLRLNFYEDAEPILISTLPSTRNYQEYIRYDKVVIINNELCYRYPVFLSESRLCTYEAIACEGDEGAPLVTCYDDLLVGLVSVTQVQAALCRYSNNCLFPVTTYTKVELYRSWIYDVTELNFL